MKFAVALLFAAAGFAQVPAQDSRNTVIPNTDTHFTPRIYKTLPEWQERREHLRKQILSAAGLLPMPKKTPLHPQIFGRIVNGSYSIEKVLLETMPPDCPVSIEVPLPPGQEPLGHARHLLTATRNLTQKQDAMP